MRRIGSRPHYQSCIARRDKTFCGGIILGLFFLPAQFMTAHGLCGSALMQSENAVAGLTSSSEEPPSAADGAGRLPPSVDEIEPPLTPSSVSSFSFWTSLKLAEVVKAGTPVMNGK